MSGFTINPETLRASANGMIDVVDRLAQELTRLESTLNGLGSPWGTLFFGLFGPVYREVHDLAMGSYEENAQVMSQYAEGLDSLAADLEELEANLVSGFEFFEAALAQGFPVVGP